MASEVTSAGGITREAERRRRRSRLWASIGRALLEAVTLLVLFQALAAVVFWYSAQMAVDCMQTLLIFVLVRWGLTLRRRLHELETIGFKVELRAELPFAAPPFMRDKKRPPEPAN